MQGKKNIREIKYYDVEKGEFLFCFTENINKIKTDKWFQSDLEEEYLHEIYPLYSPGVRKMMKYEDEDGEKMFYYAEQCLRIVMYIAN